MDASRYLELLRSDGDRLAEAAAKAGLDAEVPSCPGWTVRDLVGHTGSVYRHKIACMRLGARPAEEDWEQDPPDGVDPVEWFRVGLVAVGAELAARGPAARSYTWYPPDQTVGFWFRRMAQETAVHRVDAELALGDVTPVDPDLAVDGVDEMLVAFLGGPWWVEEPVPEATGTTYAVRTGGRAWRVTLRPEEVAVQRTDGDAAASVAGDPHDVLMWLWNRPSSGVEVEGDVTELRRRLDLGTT